MAESIPDRRERALERLFERPLSEHDLVRNTTLLSRPAEIAAAAGESLLLFERAGETLALPAIAVPRVLPTLPVHRVPHRPGPVFRGLASERGELRLVASLESLLDLAPPESPVDPSLRRMLLVDFDDEEWIFEVDRVLGVRQSDRSQWLPPPPTIAHGRGRMTAFILPLGERRAALLDPSRLVRACREALA